MQPTVSRILAAKKQWETKQSRKKISTFTLEENILKENYQYNQKVKKQFSKNMMEVQLWEGRLDGASKNKCEKTRYAYPLVIRAKYVEMTEDTCKLFAGEQQVVGNSHSMASIFSDK